ncbi:esterase/lipase family protein [Nocardia wallacei]|uniref:esterase/lipase family protein n=1 Tax=Nocardia wallacei TaxID=480035 RepID=UPI002458E7D0|nr:alpha/beta fold hydrolase [Nocardia wallacei]
MVDQAVTAWDGPVAGANDYGCRPGGEHSKPVVLVTSTFLSDAVSWTTLAPYLHNLGYCVFTFNYGREIYDVPPGLNGMDPMALSARTVAATVDRVLAATGADSVDLVGHSQGGMVARYYVNALGGAGRVDRMVLLSSPYRLTGPPVDVTALARDSIPAPVYDAMLYNGVVPPVALFGANVTDPWAWELVEPLQPEIEYVQITNSVDAFALLGGMPAPAGATNAATRYIDRVCPTDHSEHFSQQYSPTAVAMIATALDPERPVSGLCTAITGSAY